MRRTHFELEDLDLASYLVSAGLRLLRVEADSGRACFILADPRGIVASLRRAWVGERRIREYLRIRRHLRLGVKRARIHPDKVITATDLEALRYDIMADAVRRRATAGRVPGEGIGCRTP